MYNLNSSTAPVQSSGALDSLKLKVETVIRKASIMAGELTKIQQSLQNCLIILTDWRSNSTSGESSSLDSLIRRTQGSLDTTGTSYSNDLYRVKEESNDLTLVYTKQMQSLLSRLEGISNDLKSDITRKASELLSIKNEMDSHDPARRIHHSLKVHASRTQF